MTTRNVGWLCVCVAAGVAVTMMVQTRRPSRSRYSADVDPPSSDFDPIDEASDESFPASDPPSYSAVLGAQTGR